MTVIKTRSSLFNSKWTEPWQCCCISRDERDGNTLCVKALLPLHWARVSWRLHQRTCKGKNTKPGVSHTSTDVQYILKASFTTQRGGGIAKVAGCLSQSQLYLYLTTSQAVVLFYHLNKISESSSPPVQPSLHPILMKRGSITFFRCCCVHKYEGQARSEKR